MCVSKNTVCSGDFVHITPISTTADDFVSCDYCVEITAATHYIYSFDSVYNFVAISGCDDCTQGWREIISDENKQVV